MTQLANNANNQYLDLIDHYLARGYDQAAERLTIAIDQARVSIDKNPLAGRDYPAIYDKLIWQNVKWINIPVQLRQVHEMFSSRG